MRLAAGGKALMSRLDDPSHRRGLSIDEEYITTSMASQGVGYSASPNKGMKLTKLSAAPTLAPQTALGRRRRRMPAQSRMDAGTASQLIPGVLRTRCGVAGLLLARLVAGATIGLLLATLAAGASDADEASSSCPSFRALGQQLDAKIAAIKPGTPLKEFTTTTASRAFDFDNPTSRKGALFFVGVREGNASVVDELECRFDSVGRLVRCRRECCRSESRRVSLDQYNSIALGQTRIQVEAKLCAPSDVESAKAGKVKTYYHIPLPVGHHDEGQTVMLVFDNDRLSFKGMSPYY
jgi:hypothetical protein